MANKTASLFIRIEPDIKEQAESILSTLGISPSNAINIFYKQIILQHGIPFEIKVPNISNLTAEEFDIELEKGLEDIRAGKTEPIEKVFDELKK